MKSAAAAVVLTLWAFAATGATAADTCLRGQQCTNAQGQASRCNSVGECLSNLQACPSSSVLLQRCHPTKTRFCFPLFDNSTPQCLDLTEIDAVVGRDACTGKSDGTKCVFAYSDMNGPSLETATVFELEGMCMDSECLSGIHVSCKDKPLSETCSYESIEKGNLVRLSGSCRSRGFNRMNRCESFGSATVIGPAKVLTKSPLTPAPSSATSAPNASKTPAPSSGSVASDSEVTNPFDNIWRSTSAPYTFAPYVPETPRPASYVYTSSSSDSDPTVKIVLGVLGAVLAVTVFIVRQARRSSPPEDAAPVVVVDHPHTPEIDAAYTKLEAGGGQNVAQPHAAGAGSNARP